MIIRRAWIPEGATVCWRVLVAGRVAGLELSRGEHSWGFWSIHNYGLSDAELQRVREHAAHRVQLAVLDPFRNLDVWGGDFNCLEVARTLSQSSRDRLRLDSRSLLMQKLGEKLSVPCANSISSHQHIS